MSSSGQPVGRASGFFYKTELDKLYFVTDWHVVTGRHPRTPAKSSLTVPPPHLARLKLHKRVDDIRISRSQKLQLDLNLYEADGLTPVWFEHPVHGHKVDVVSPFWKSPRA